MSRVRSLGGDGSGTVHVLVLRCGVPNEKRHELEKGKWVLDIHYIPTLICLYRLTFAFEENIALGHGWGVCSTCSVIRVSRPDEDRPERDIYRMLAPMYSLTFSILLTCIC